MQAHDTTLVSLFSGDEVRYFIPVYQRNYNWNRKQCLQLFNDICSIINNENNHFFGSVVLLNNKNDCWSVIDGQQRLTTVSLIWIAMSQLVKDGVKVVDKATADNLQRKYCFSNSDGGKISRIEHVEKDKKAFMALILGDKDNYVKDSNITNNFYLFYDKIKESEYSIKSFDNAIKRLSIAKISLDNGDNPQLVFESLNSTGLALSDGDKIRNFMLMNLKIEQQNEYYKRYWTHIEEDSNYNKKQKDALDAVTFFVRDYLTAKEARIPALHSVYFKFKEFINNARNRNNSSTEELLADMKKFARYLHELETGDTNSVHLNIVLKRIALLEMSVIHPFGLNVLDDYHSNKLSENETVKIFELIENFIFRRLLCDVPTNALNKIFATLHGIASDLSKEEGLSFYDSVAYLLVSKSDSGRFPSDEEFKEAWATKNIYKMRTKNKIYIFYRLNTGGSIEGDTSVIDKMQQDDQGKISLSIEHIIPQTLNNKWKEELGGEFAAKRIQEQWEHTIANLTLTAYNSPYSNNSFNEKLTLRDENGHGIGFKFSPLHINDFIKNQTEWGEKQLKERLDIIQNESTQQIWKMPKIKYTPTHKIREELSIEDEKSDFTGKSFIDGTVCGSTIPLKPRTNWKTVFITVLKMLDKDYHRELEQLANDNSQSILQDKETAPSNTDVVFNGIHVNTNTSTATKIDSIRKILEHIGLDLNSISFHVEKDDNRSSSEKDMSKAEILPLS